MQFTKFISIAALGLVSSISAVALDGPAMAQALEARNAGASISGSSTTAVTTQANIVGSVAGGASIITGATYQPLVAPQLCCGLLDLGCWLEQVVLDVGGIVFDVLAIVKQLVAVVETGLAFDIWLVESFAQSLSGQLSYNACGAFANTGFTLLKTPYTTYYGATQVQFTGFCNELNTNYYVTKKSITKPQFTALCTKYNVQPAVNCAK